MTAPRAPRPGPSLGSRLFEALRWVGWGLSVYGWDGSLFPYPHQLGEYQFGAAAHGPHAHYQHEESPR